MTTKYWVQRMSTGGNWYDSLGTNDLEDAIKSAKYYASDGGTARVVVRHDTEIAQYNNNNT